MKLPLYLEDRYDNMLTVDRKHCNDDEVRLVINGHEYYLDGPTIDLLSVALVMTEGLDR